MTWEAQRTAALKAMKIVSPKMKEHERRYLMLRKVWERHWKLYHEADRQLSKVRVIAPRVRQAKQEDPVKALKRKFGEMSSEEKASILAELMEGD